MEHFDSLTSHRAGGLRLGPAHFFSIATRACGPLAATALLAVAAGGCGNAGGGDDRALLVLPVVGAAVPPDPPPTLAPASATALLARFATLEVINGSNEAVHHLLVSSAASGFWGEDQLGTRTIPIGNSFRLLEIPPGVWDVMVIDASGNTKQWRHTFKAGVDYTVTVDGAGWTLNPTAAQLEWLEGLLEADEHRAREFERQRDRDLAEAQRKVRGVEAMFGVS